MTATVSSEYDDATIRRASKLLASFGICFSSSPVLRDAATGGLEAMSYECSAPRCLIIRPCGAELFEPRLDGLVVLRSDDFFQTDVLACFCNPRKLICLFCHTCFSLLIVVGKGAIELVFRLLRQSSQSLIRGIESSALSALLLGLDSFFVERCCPFVDIFELGESLPLCYEGAQELVLRVDVEVAHIVLSIINQVLRIDILPLVDLAFVVGSGIVIELGELDFIVIINRISSSGDFCRQLELGFDCIVFRQLRSFRFSSFDSIEQRLLRCWCFCIQSLVCCFDVCFVRRIACYRCFVGWFHLFEQVYCIEIFLPCFHELRSVALASSQIKRIQLRQNSISCCMTRILGFVFINQALVIGCCILLQKIQLDGFSATVVDCTSSLRFWQLQRGDCCIEIGSLRCWRLLWLCRRRRWRLL
nr:MAG TPA: hypothetical protein [Caudoviricetes sp.]